VEQVIMARTLPGTRQLRELLKTVTTGQRFLEGFEVMHALRHDHVRLRRLVPDYRGGRAIPHDRTRAVAAAMSRLAMSLVKPT
jgi:hypothetical protein